MESTSHKPYVKFSKSGNTKPILAYDTVRVDDPQDVTSNFRNARVPLVPHDGELVPASEIEEDFEIILHTDKKILHG